MRKRRSKEWEADLDLFDKGRPGSYAASKAYEAAHAAEHHAERATHEQGRPGSYAASRALQHIDADAEHEYWRQHYVSESYCAPGAPFEYYETAFQIGYEGRERYAHHDFDQVEPELEAEYRRRSDPSDPPWREVREAARSAWNRCTRAASEHH